MARTSRMEILVLSSIARKPMHGYEIKLEFRYKHVSWWTKADHGHIYATLNRLEKQGHIQVVEGGSRRRKVFDVTEQGRAHLQQMLVETGRSRDATAFDIDLFVSSSFLLELDEALAVLDERVEVLQAQIAEAHALQKQTAPYVPVAARLIIEHRVEHLELELRYANKAREAFVAQSRWGSFLGDRSIEDFVEQAGAALED